MNGAPRGRRLVGVAITLLCVALPALFAGATIDGPAREGELGRLAAAITERDLAEAHVDALWLGWLAGDDPSPTAVAARLPLARLAAVAGILVTSALLWVTVTIARGRVHALLACGAFAVLPAVAVDGAVLRPELPTTVFAALAVLLLVNLPERLRVARCRRRVADLVSVGLLGVAVATAIGLAVAAAPAYGSCLFVPALATLAVIQRDGLALLRVLRRFRGLILPFRAVTLRLLPWAIPSFGALVATTLLLPDGRESLPTLGLRGLLGDSAALAIPLLLLAALGATRLLLRIGLSLSRGGRLDARIVLGLAIAAPLVQRIARGAELDALPFAPALAVLVAEGAWLGVLFGAARLGGLRRRAPVVRA